MQNQGRSRVGRPQGPKTGSLEDKEESPGRGLWWLLRCYHLQKSGQGLCNWLRLSRPWESSTVEKGQCWWRVKGRGGVWGSGVPRTHTHTHTDTALPAGPRPTSWGWTDAGDGQTPGQGGAAASLGATAGTEASPRHSLRQGTGMEQRERQVLVNPASGKLAP